MEQTKQKLLGKWQIHQKGCAFILNVRGKWHLNACDMNCENVLDTVLGEISKDAFSAGREAALKEVREKLLTKANEGRYMAISKELIEQVLSALSEPTQ